MPDFSAISKALGGVDNILKGLLGVFGSLAGNGVGPALETIGLGSAEATA